MRSGLVIECQVTHIIAAAAVTIRERYANPLRTDEINLQVADKGMVQIHRDIDILDQSRATEEIEEICVRPRDVSRTGGGLIIIDEIHRIGAGIICEELLARHSPIGGVTRLLPLQHGCGSAIVFKPVHAKISWCIGRQVSRPVIISAAVQCPVTDNISGPPDLDPDPVVSKGPEVMPTSSLRYHVSTPDGINTVASAADNVTGFPGKVDLRVDL